MEENRQLPRTLVEMRDVMVDGPGHSNEDRIGRIDWEVRQSDYWVVGGLPGAGKSSLLETAAGLVRPRSGEHRLFGIDVAAMDETQWLQIRARIGFVFSYGARLFKQLTVAENLSLPLSYHRNCEIEETKDRVGVVLNWTGLESLANSRPDQVPRNLHQRVGLARALALSPELLILDNPLAGMDLRQTRWWLDFLDAMSAGEHPDRRPITVVVAADDLRPWSGRARDFALLHRSEWLLIGGRGQLESHDHPILMELLARDIA